MHHPCFGSTLALPPVPVSRFGCVPPISHPTPSPATPPDLAPAPAPRLTPTYWPACPLLFVSPLSPRLNLACLRDPVPSPPRSRSRTFSTPRPAPPAPFPVPSRSSPRAASRFAFAPSSSTCPLSAIFSPWTWTSCSSRADASPRPFLETLPFDLSWPCTYLHSMTGLSPFRLTPSAHHPFPCSGLNGLHARPLLAPPFLRISPPPLGASALLALLASPPSPPPSPEWMAPGTSLFSPPRGTSHFGKTGQPSLGRSSPARFRPNFLNCPPPREARAGLSPRQRACNPLAAGTGQQRVLETKVVIPTRASTPSGFYIKNATPKKSLVSLWELI